MKAKKLGESRISCRNFHSTIFCAISATLFLRQKYENTTTRCHFLLLSVTHYRNDKKVFLKSHRFDTLTSHFGEICVRRWLTTTHCFSRVRVWVRDNETMKLETNCACFCPYISRNIGKTQIFVQKTYYIYHCVKNLLYLQVRLSQDY